MPVDTDGRETLYTKISPARVQAASSNTPYHYSGSACGQPQALGETFSLHFHVYIHRVQRWEDRKRDIQHTAQPANQPPAGVRWNRSNGIELESQTGYKWRALGGTPDPDPVRFQLRIPLPPIGPIRPSPTASGQSLDRRCTCCRDGPAPPKAPSPPRRAPTRHYMRSSIYVSTQAVPARVKDSSSPSSVPP